MVDEGLFRALASDVRKKIKAKLLKAAAACFGAPQVSPSPDCMRQAFHEIAQVLFDARILKVELLPEISLLVWESAVAGGWFFITQATLDEFAKQRGHDGVWSDQDALFRAQIAGWQAELLEASATQASERSAYRAQPPTPEEEVSVRPAPRAGMTQAEAVAELAARRQAVVNPILRRKRWKRGKWATAAGVSKNSVYEYLEGKRKLGDENREAMAETLDLKMEDLPE